uniref:Malate dehydrogenase 1B, NAD (soluble) n=1 Tax=Salmo trutta TaxID=8032 RepID=A0A673YD57_SALTR
MAVLVSFSSAIIWLVQLMMKIATKNLLTQELCMKEEVYHQSLIKPLHIWISSKNIENVWLKYDLALPQLHKVTVYTEKVSDRYQQYGRLINERVHMNVAVIVAGDSLVNLKCSLLLENAPSVDSGRFVGMATQLEYEAKAHIAQKLSVKTADVTEVIVWGNISGSSHVDLQSATVFQYEGAIWGPSDFSQPVLEIIYDRKWLQSDFLNLVSSQCATVASKSQRATAISATNGIIAVLKAWNCHSSAKEVLSFCILSTGQYNLPAGVVFSMPVSFQDGRWSMLSDVIGDKKRAKLQIAADQLRERDQIFTNSRGNICTALPSFLWIN